MVYTVSYKMHQASKVRKISVPAKSKWEAFDKASFEIIPDKEDGYPYSVWVSSVTYQNGNYKLFNTFEGKPI